MRSVTTYAQTVARRLSPVVALTGALLLATAPAPAASNHDSEVEEMPEEDGIVYEDAEVTIVRDGPWIHRDYTLRLEGARTNRHEGEKKPDGTCTYSAERTFTEGDLEEGVALIEREIAHNPDDCVMISEEGTPEEESGEEQEGDGSSGDSGHVEPPGEVETDRKDYGEDDDVSIAASRSLWYEGRFRDPAQITVNSARAGLDWVYDGSCVTSGTASWRWYWVTWSGWELTSQDKGGGLQCDRAWSTVRATYRNSQFCAGQPTTYTDYKYVQINGRADGSAYGRYSWEKWGGCHTWLSWETEWGSG